MALNTNSTEGLFFRDDNNPVVPKKIIPEYYCIILSPEIQHKLV